VVLLPIPDPNKPEEHEAWCPLGLVALLCKDNIVFMHVVMCKVCLFSWDFLHISMVPTCVCYLSSISDHSGLIYWCDWL